MIWYFCLAATVLGILLHLALSKQHRTRPRLVEVALLSRIIQCATKARDASGGRFHPDN